MEGLTFEDVQAFAHSWGSVYFVVLFAIVCVYVMWPSNKSKFDEAAQAPLKDDAP